MNAPPACIGGGYSPGGGIGCPPKAIAWTDPAPGAVIGWSGANDDV